MSLWSCSASSSGIALKHTAISITNKSISSWRRQVKINHKYTNTSVSKPVEFSECIKTYSALQNEQLNEQLEQAGKTPTQDTSRWFYKSQEELAWELMGIACEKKLSTRTRAEKPDTFR